LDLIDGGRDKLDLEAALTLVAEGKGILAADETVPVDKTTGHARNPAHRAKADALSGKCSLPLLAPATGATTYIRVTIPEYRCLRNSMTYY